MEIEIATEEASNQGVGLPYHQAIEKAINQDYRQSLMTICSQVVEVLK
jgi:hypothetical protein